MKAAQNVKDMIVTFWGVRGTLPTPGKSTLRYGGNTSCVEISVADKGLGTSVVLDAGSGIVAYGDHALAKGQRQFHLFLSHMHYDHMIGLTRFAPLFRKDCEITVYGQSKCGLSLEHIFKQFFAAPFFPIVFEDLPSKSKLRFVEMNDINLIRLHGVTVACHPLNHPQQSIAFRVWDQVQKNSVVYATDHEHGTVVDQELSHFCKGANLLIYDTTYEELRYPQFRGWGHSTASAGAKLAKSSNVKAFGVFHHDPASSDQYLEKALLKEARKTFPRSFLCKEGFAVSVESLAKSTVQTLSRLLKSVPGKRS